MPALKAIFSADAKPFASELTNAERLAKVSASRMTSSLGSINFRGAFSELIVIGRELSRGNFSRIPGSISLMVQRLGLLKYVLSPFAAIIAAVAGAGYLFIRMSKQAVDSAQSLYQVVGGSGNRFLLMADAMETASKRAQEFNDWLKNLGVSHETLSDKAEETLKAMREEAAMKHKLASERGATPSQLAQMEIASLKEQAKALRDLKESEEGMLFRSKAVAKQAEARANNPKTEREIKDLEERKKEIGRRLDEARKEYERRFSAIPEGAVGGALHTPVTIKSGDKDVETSVAKETKAYEAINTQLDAYVAKQKAADDAAKAAKEEAQRRQGSVTKLTKDLRETNADLALKEKYSPELAKYQHQQLLRGSLTSLQSQGAFAPKVMPSLVDIASKSLTVLKEIKKNTEETKNQKSGAGAFGGVKF